MGLFPTLSFNSLVTRHSKLHILHKGVTSWTALKHCANRRSSALSPSRFGTQHVQLMSARAPVQISTVTRFDRPTGWKDSSIPLGPVLSNVETKASAVAVGLHIEDVDALI